jgi:carbon-monoxide dehydrogenase small subunit
MPDVPPPPELGERPVLLHVNGQERCVVIEPRALLVHALRDGLGLTGTHIGCDTSQCGACTVLMDGRSVKSCTLFAVQAAGHEIVTIEGLGDRNALHPMQEAFWLEHGLQCGFCTPGMIVSAVALLGRNPDPSEGEIRKGLDGNICRCTGYENIVRAVRAAGAALREHRPRRGVMEIFPEDGPLASLEHVIPQDDRR